MQCERRVETTVEEEEEEEGKEKKKVINAAVATIRLDHRWLYAVHVYFLFQHTDDDFGDGGSGYLEGVDSSFLQEPPT